MTNLMNLTNHFFIMKHQIIPGQTGLSQIEPTGIHVQILSSAIHNIQKIHYDFGNFGLSTTLYFPCHCFNKQEGR